MDRQLNMHIDRLVRYAAEKGLIEQEDKVYTINRLLALFKEDEYEPASGDEPEEAFDLAATLDALTDIAAGRGLLRSEGVAGRDLFDTEIMGVLTPRPSCVARVFWENYAADPVKATDAFYAFSGDVNYIRRDRIAKDMRWQVESPYGMIDVTINLSKPEKDPRDIAAARSKKQSAYPKCQLCIENEGYAGRLDHPARANHRIIPITLTGQEWGFQYSPYVYYNEHCIVLNRSHVPMKIDRGTFSRLLDFVGQFPHYFLGSNADLPIVGGSILTHDHFQGGRYTFAMERANIEKTVTFSGFRDVEAGILNWPMSAIRIRSRDRARLIDLADRILTSWRGYSDPDAFIFAQTDGEPHNTITPIARVHDGVFELDLVLRNNITTEEYPLGVYHPHQELHHIKKENIGLIEVMGLAVLPARLKTELHLVADCMLAGGDITGAVREDPRIEKHADWVGAFLPGYPEITAENVMEILKQETGKVFVRVLEDAGVYKCTPEGREAFARFTDQV